MADIIMESVVQIVVTLMLTLIGVLGTWLTLKLGKKEELAAINVAQQEVIRLAHLTVEELQQTLVEGLKAAHEDGKLTKEEIAALGEALLDGTIAKMSAPTAKLLAAAAVDTTALIQGAGEAWIAKLKAGNVTE
jgi:hypothetical protein